MHIIEFNDVQVDIAVRAILRHGRGELHIPADIRQLLLKIARPKLPSQVLDEEEKVHLW